MCICVFWKHYLVTKVDLHEWISIKSQKKLNEIWIIYSLLWKADDFGHEDVDACKQEYNRVNKKRIMIGTGIKTDNRLIFNEWKVWRWYKSCILETQRWKKWERREMMEERDCMGKFHILLFLFLTNLDLWLFMR